MLKKKKTFDIPGYSGQRSSHSALWASRLSLKSQEEIDVLLSLHDSSVKRKYRFIGPGQSYTPDLFKAKEQNNGAMCQFKLKNINLLPVDSLFKLYFLSFCLSFSLILWWLLLCGKGHR